MPTPPYRNKRVVGFGGLLGHRAGRSVGELIARANDKVVEGVFGIQLRCSIPIEALLGDSTEDRVIGRR